MFGHRHFGTLAAWQPPSITSIDRIDATPLACCVCRIFAMTLFSHGFQSEVIKFSASRNIGRGFRQKFHQVFKSLQLSGILIDQCHIVLF